MKISFTFLFSIILALVICQQSWGYNQNHGPFEESQEPDQFKIYKLDRLKPIASNIEIRVFGQKDNESAHQVRLLPCLGASTVTYATVFDSDGWMFGPEIVSRHCTDGSVYRTDLNKDNKDDYIVWVWAEGSGLSGGSCDIAFILSNHKGYKCTRISTLNPGMKDFVDLKGDGSCQFIHTSFANVNICMDGKPHNFWVYNILTFEGDEVKVNNSIIPAFPKTIWFTYKPNHKETSIITNQQKEIIRNKALMGIFDEEVDWKNINLPNDKNLVNVKSIRSGDTPIQNFWGDKTYTVRITSDPKCIIDAELIDLTNPKYCWSEGRKHFELLDEANNVVVDYIFYSSYGSYDIDVVDLNNDGKMEFVFVLGEGRGTAARRLYLGVYEVTGDHLQKLYSAKYKDWFSYFYCWWYDRQYRDTNGDGTTDLELILDHCPIGLFPDSETPGDIPKEKVKVFR